MPGGRKNKPGGRFFRPKFSSALLIPSFLKPIFSFLLPEKSSARLLLLKNWAVLPSLF